MGWLELLVGCMFASKTQRLQWRIQQERFSYHHTEHFPSVELFKPKLDTRYGQENKVISHDGIALPCVVVEGAQEILSYVQHHPSLRVVGIDEIQFFDGDILPVVRKLMRDYHTHIIASGLNLDFRGEPFRFRDSEEHMGTLIAQAHNISSLHARCAYVHPDSEKRCGVPAYYTQRLFPDGNPVPYDDPLVLVGGKDTHNDRRYEARCFQHHVVPGRPW